MATRTTPLPPHPSVDSRLEAPRAPTPSSAAKHAPRATVACGRCRVEWTCLEWWALPVVTRVADAELALLVSRWPEQVVVVVRTCSCGAPIARLVPRRAALACK
jgi:hypothetical protein